METSPAPAPAPAPSSSAWRTAASAARFTGRATRSEMAAYVIAALLVSVPVSFLTGLLLPYAQHLLATNVVTVLLALPVPALLVRRYHDAGRSGRWVWLAVGVFALWLARTVLAATLGPDAREQFDRVAWLLDWAVLVANLVTVLLVLLPGTAGPNRFGDDPRQRVPVQP